MPYAKEAEFVLYPDINLPDIDKNNMTTVAEKFMLKQQSMDNIFQSSAYYLKKANLTKKDCPEVERYSDREKQKKKTRSGSIFEFLQLRRDNFPPELIEGRRLPKKRKKVQWNQDSDMQKFFEKLEKRDEINERTGGKETKDDEDEENEEEEEEEAVSSEDEGDYATNIDFDDDDVDVEDDNDNDDEPYYE